MTTPSQPAGYSKRPLAEKLGIKAGMHVAILNAPKEYISATLIGLPDGLTMADKLSKNAASRFDFIQFFTTLREELEAQFPALKAALAQNGALWISWPKGGPKAQITTNLDENIVREAGLAAGLVDVKVAAVDPVWSGLKFVYRVKDRTKDQG